jgi:hypothetical protein
MTFNSNFYTPNTSATIEQAEKVLESRDSKELLSSQ